MFQNHFSFSKISNSAFKICNSDLSVLAYVHNLNKGMNTGGAPPEIQVIFIAIIRVVYFKPGEGGALSLVGVPA